MIAILITLILATPTQAANLVASGATSYHLRHICKRESWGCRTIGPHHGDRPVKHSCRSVWRSYVKMGKVTAPYHERPLWHVLWVAVRTWGHTHSRYDQISEARQSSHRMAHWEGDWDTCAWMTRGAWGISPGANAAYLWPGASPYWWDVPIVAAWGAKRKLEHDCKGGRWTGWCA